MIDLRNAVERIESLLADDSSSSATYAALEARLALERACYDRLRQCHDYIAHEDLARWQPALIVKQLLTDVDRHASQTVTLSISTEPVSEGRENEDYDYVKIGTQIGIDPKKIASLWNALSNLALHATLPKTRNDQIPEYGEKNKIVSKVREAVVELTRISKSTMTFSGIGPEVKFACECGAMNKRRLSQIRQNQEVSCINPSCEWSWIAKATEEGFDFEPAGVSVACQACSNEDRLPFRGLKKLGFGDIARWNCERCGEQNEVRLIFGQRTKK